jgi:hypothetical protein
MALSKLANAIILYKLLSVIAAIIYNLLFILIIIYMALIRLSFETV